MAVSQGFLIEFPSFFQISLHMLCQFIVSRSKKKLIKRCWYVQYGSALSANLLFHQAEIPPSTAKTFGEMLLESIC